jgi:PAS domain S-box-containing protein
VSDRDLYSIGEVAALLGVSTHTIRAWERRYGILRPERTHARQRRYRREDIELLQDVKRAIDVSGVSLRLAFEAATGTVEPIRGPRLPIRQQRVRRFAPSNDADLWRSIGDVLPQLIMIIDRDGTIVEANVAVAKALGVVRQRLTGRKFIEVVDPFDRGKASMLYRPQLRIVPAWELNVSTREGARLYSFQSWTVRQQDRMYLALVGAEMFSAGESASDLDDRARASDALAAVQSHPSGGPAAVNTLQNLLHKLPFGVAVTTIGPSPRIVYSNDRLSETLGLRPRRLLGRPLEELMPDEAVIRALREAVESRRPRKLRDVELRLESGNGNHGRYFNLTFRPMFSTGHKVTSALVVVEDETTDVVDRAELANLVAGEQFGGARTFDQLADLALRHLARALPGMDFLISLDSPRSAKGANPSLHLSNGWSVSARDVARGPVGRIVHQVSLSGAAVERTVGRRSESMRIWAVPVVATASHSAAGPLGVVAWRRHGKSPPGPHERAVIRAFVARLAVAAEHLHVRRGGPARSSRPLDDVAVSTTS